MKKLLLFICASLFFFEPSYCQLKNVKSFKFDKIIVLAFKLQRTPKVDSKLPDVVGKPVEAKDYAYSANLTKTEQVKFYSFLISAASAIETDEKCWNPDFGAYFMYRGNCVNYIQISSDCENLKSLIDIGNFKSLNENLPTKINHEFLNFVKQISSKYNFPNILPYSFSNY